ncbi:MAG: peptidylprolyl isomerase [Gammaproteobacteria bacterium]|nr:peptidylprolyl isomerase [Gammaproteobacteria bacterium]
MRQPVSAGIALDRIVAVVNDDVIMQSELDDRLRTVKNQLSEQGTPLPPGPILERQVLDRLILTKLQVQEAQHSGIRVDDETLNRTISNIAAQNQLSLEKFREVLESDGYSYEKFREDIRSEILVSRLQQRQVDNRVTVTEREIENYLATQEHQGEDEAEYLLRHILIAVPETASSSDIEATTKLAEKVLVDLRAGADFASMAATYSKGPQALEGGNLGWRKASQVPTLFADVVAHMQKGDVSDLIRNAGGFHIVKLEEVRDSEKHVITQTHVRHILIKSDELTTEDDAQARLEQVRLRIVGGADFAELARGNSNDTVSAAEGGDLGWMSPGDLVGDFEEVMNSLAPGEISQPFHTDYGWHIAQVLDRRQHDNSQELKRSQAREAIRRRKLDEARENWLREMRDEAYVEYRLES